MNLLDVRELVVAYDNKQVLHGVDLAVPAGKITALVGHNGAGKTTLLRAVIGLAPRRRGSVRFDGAELQAGDVASNVRRGIAFVSQGRNTFRSMTIAENLAVAVSSSGNEAQARLPTVEDMFPLLKERRTSVASTLSGGQQQMVALALALVRGPRLIVLDEPSTGLAPVLVTAVFQKVIEMRERLGMSVLVVDQNVKQLLGFCDRLSVLKAGRIVFDGLPGDIAGDRHLWELF
jgi:branched-chain amino acid transport system ATP-binding protein